MKSGLVSFFVLYLVDEGCAGTICTLQQVSEEGGTHRQNPLPPRRYTIAIVNCPDPPRFLIVAVWFFGRCVSWFSLPPHVTMGGNYTGSDERNLNTF